MAKLDSRGFVDDGSADLVVSGQTTLSAVVLGSTSTTGDVSITGKLAVTGSLVGFSSAVDVTGAMTVNGNITHTGSLVYNKPATSQVTANSDDLTYTTISVANKLVVPVSASCLSASGGFNASGAANGQSCYFLNVGAKPVIMLGYADAASVTIDPSTAAQALYYDSAWYHMSGTL